MKRNTNGLAVVRPRRASVFSASQRFLLCLPHVAQRPQMGQIPPLLSQKAFTSRRTFTPKLRCRPSAAWFVGSASLSELRFVTEMRFVHQVLSFVSHFCVIFVSFIEKALRLGAADLSE